MNALRPYNPATDKRAGMNRARRGTCSTVWCRQPAAHEWTTNSGQTRYVCAAHALPDAELEPLGGFAAAGAGDGRYHDVPFLKKYGA